MLRTSKGGTASGIAGRFYRLTTRGCSAAIFAGLLTSCLETAGALNQVRGGMTFAALGPELAPISSAPSRPRTPPTTHSSAAEPVSSRPYSDGYWAAVAELDFAGIREAARSEQEILFAEAIVLLAAAEHEKAEAAFRSLSSQTEDLSVASASQMMLASTLMYQHKWATLRDARSGSEFGLADRHNATGMERWGQAFADLDPPMTTIPEAPVTLPLGITPVGTPIITVRINGKEYRLWLDTGSSITVLSSDVAADAGVPVLNSDTLTVATFAGIAPARPAVVRQLEIGPISLRNTPAIVIDAGLMRVKSTADGVPWSGLQVDGIVGWDTIRQFAIAMNFDAGTITLQRPPDLGTIGTPSQNLTWMGKPFIEVRTRFGTTLHFALDTGAQASFINGSVLKRANVSATNSATRAYGIARTGGQAAQIVPVLRLDMAGNSLMLRNLIVYNPPSSGLVNCDGILGSDISQFGTIRIDATNGLFSIDAG